MATTTQAQQRAEINELKRVAANRILEQAATGRRFDPVTLRWARMFCAAHKPLGRPLGTGAPEDR